MCIVLILLLCSIVSVCESTSHPTLSTNFTSEIPLWPHGVAIPGERPGSIGKETVQCRTKNTTTGICLDRRISNVTFPTLIPFTVPSSDAAVVIAAGGGYKYLAIDRAGTDIADWLNSIGISAFVLKYRVPEREWLPFGEAPLMDAQRAMGIVRNMAEASSSLLPHLNVSKVGFVGFSAGAQLTGHLNVAWQRRAYPPVDPLDEISCRPDFSIMVYPWRSVSQPPVNEPGATALNVTKDTPPTMLIQTEDDAAHVENSLYYFLALKQAGAPPSELHVYPRGGHGYGRCTLPGTIPKDTTVCSWPDRAEDFLKSSGVLKKKLVGFGDNTFVRKAGAWAALPS
jgi:acetyl esterase/lipase